MGEDELRLDDLTEFSSLYIQWPEHLIDADAKPLALVLHTLVTCLCHKADHEGGRLPYPTLFALDEITRYHVPALPQYISTMLGRGMAALLYAQSFAQLVSKYREAEATVIEGNCGVEMYYRPQSDTAEKLERELGQVSLPSERVSRRLSNLERTVSQGEQSRPLMTRDEIRLLKEDQTLILTDSHRPILARRVNPFKVKWLRQRLDLPLLEVTRREVVPSPEPRKEVSPTAFFDFDEAELGQILK
jgi:type IV secretory pathway TraG/TraD family ATPase VirD4